MKKTKRAAPKKKGTSTAPITKTIGLPKTRIALPPATMTEAAILDAFDMLGIASKLDERQKRLFITVAKENRLNPLKRQIHAVAMWDQDTGETKLVPVTGYEVYIDRAEESGRLQYWNPVESGTVTDAVKGIGDFRCTVVIKRRDWPKEFEWTAHYSEAVRKKKDGTTGRMWRERPKFMTMKVAISQGFRLCFRDVLSGMPYTFDEMTDGEVGHEIAKRQPIKEPRVVNPETRGEDNDAQREEEPRRAPISQPQPRKDEPVPVQHEERKPLTEYEKGLKYLETTETDSKSKHIVPLFTENERLDYTHELGQAKNNPEELAKTIADIIDIGKNRRAAVKGEMA